jgi:hypothetical protein
MRASLLQVPAVVCLAVLAFASCAHEAEEKIPDPGFRPHSEYAPAFLEALETDAIAVYPSIIRTVDGTYHSAESQQKIVSLLKEKKIAAAVAQTSAIDPGALKGQSQWDIFQNDMRTIAEQLKSRNSDAAYNLIMEFLFPPGNQSVFGIHCYVLDQQGENAFSFLLNSHHKLFVDANLSAEDSSEASRAILIDKAAQVGVTALLQQVKAPGHQHTVRREGYSITTQKISTFDKNVKRIFVIITLQESLIPVFMHSFEHSLISAFESNGVDAIVKITPKEADALAESGKEVKMNGPDATMHINIDPLYRRHKDGRQAIVGTEFEASLINIATGEMAWHATGKVDYIIDRFFNRSGYTAHEGIRKEFAWHTTAAIVRAFIADVNGQKSVPIYTVTEDRQRHGQRTD